jgi:hypothetical protein
VSRTIFSVAGKYFLRAIGRPLVRLKPLKFLVLTLLWRSPNLKGRIRRVIHGPVPALFQSVPELPRRAAEIYADIVRARR